MAETLVTTPLTKNGRAPFWPPIGRFLIQALHHHSGGCINNFISCYSRPVTPSPRTRMAVFRPLQPICQRSRWSPAFRRSPRPISNPLPGPGAQARTHWMRDSGYLFTYTQESFSAWRENALASMDKVQLAQLAVSVPGPVARSPSVGRRASHKGTGARSRREGKIMKGKMISGCMVLPSINPVGFPPLCLRAFV